MKSKFGSLGSKKSKKKVSQMQERRVAEDVGGHAMPGSGSIDGFKGDVVCNDFIVECKFTAQKAYSVKTSELNKISRESFERDREPLFLVRFDKGVSSIYENTWVLVPDTVFSAFFDEDSFELEFTDVRNNSHLFGSIDINRISKKAIKSEKTPAVKYKYYKGISLGVDCTWYAMPYPFLLESEVFK